jgi:zinc transport system substrate-binding protein
MKHRTICSCLLLVGVLLLLLSVSGCKAKPKDDRPLIITSIYPYELLLQELIGDGVRVQSLIPASASPHTWSPKAKDIKKLDEAKLLVMNGLGLEEQLTDAFKQRSDKLIDLSALINITPVEKSRSREVNPHIWLSPQYLIRMAMMLADQLQSHFPEQTAVINQNTMTLINNLSSMHQQISKERAMMDNPAIVTYHDSFHYFALDYGIAVPATVQPSAGKEPTSKELAALGNIIKANKINTIFVEPQMDKRSAKVLADEFGLKIQTLDPLGHEFKAKRITDLIWTNWQNIKLALQGEEPLP